MKKVIFNVFFIVFILTICIFKLPSYAEDKNSFIGWIEQVTDDRTKEWTIEFNSTVDKNSITSDNIYIKDADRKMIQTKLLISNSWLCKRSMV